MLAGIRFERAGIGDGKAGASVEKTVVYDELAGISPALRDPSVGGAGVNSEFTRR